MNAPVTSSSRNGPAKSGLLRRWWRQLTQRAETVEPTPDVAPEPVSPADLQDLQLLGRLQIFEPFEGWQHLETLRRTRAVVESGIGRSLGAVRDGLGHLGERFQTSRIRNRLSDAPEIRRRLRQVLDTLYPQNAIAKLIPSRNVPALREFANFAEGMRNLAADGYRDAGAWARTAGLDYLQRSLDALFTHKPERWIRKRARTLIRRPSAAAPDGLEYMATLSRWERERLLDEVYPYDMPGFTKYMRALDLSVNVGLGAVVASNLPFTGPVVSVLNMIKTIFKIAHRLHLMATVHGRRITGTNALFLMSARILKSLQSWESDPHHRPLALQEFDALFYEDKSTTRFAELSELFQAAAQKDAYIAVPGVGSIGIGKISLDDARMDECIRTTMTAYFLREELRARLDGSDRRVDDISASFAEIYEVFHRRDYYGRIRDAARAARKADTDLTPKKDHGTLTMELDVAVRRIYNRLRDVEFATEDERKQFLCRYVDEELEGLLPA